MKAKWLPFIGLLLSGVLLGETYYVAPNGNDSYSKAQAQNPQTPWRSMKYAASMVTAGDSIIIEEGTYYESDIQFSSSGTSTDWIVISAESGSKPILTGTGTNGIMIFGDKNNPYTKSYFMIRGLTLTGYQNDGIRIFYSDYIVLSNIHAYDNGNAGINIIDSDHIIVQDSELHHNGWNSTGNSGWGDGLSINNHKAIGRTSIVRRNIMYANWQKRPNAYWDGNGFTLDMAGDGGIHIVANNIFLNNGGTGLLAGDTGSIFLIHNIFYRNMCDSRCRNYADLYLVHTGVDDARVKNNIIYSRPGAWTINRYEGTDNAIVNNNLIWGEDEESTKIWWLDWEAVSMEFWISNRAPITLTGNPGFVSAPLDNEFTTFHGSEWIEMSIDDYDFRLKHNSQCIDEGTFLTKTTNGGSGREIPVETAGYFTDGFGIEDQGDVIQIESNSPVRITSVDYHNNVITVNQSISWNDGDGVSLLYYGPAPDIGAYEYTLQYLPHQSYDIHATLSLTRPVTWGDKTISILLTTSKSVIKVPTPLILNESDGTTTNIPLEGEIPGQNFFGNLKLDDSIADGLAFFQLPEESLIGIEGSVGNTIIQGDSITIDQTPPISPLSIEIKK